MGPHGNLGRHVDELEVSGHGFEVAFAFIDLDFKECIIVAVASGIILAQGCKFLVGWVVGGRNIVSQENCIGD